MNRTLASADGPLLCTALEDHSASQDSSITEVGVTHRGHAKEQQHLLALAFWEWLFLYFFFFSLMNFLNNLRPVVKEKWVECGSQTLGLRGDPDIYSHAGALHQPLSIRFLDSSKGTMLNEGQVKLYVSC